MANKNSPHDDNYVAAVLFAQQGATSFVAPGQIDQITGRILVDVSGGTGNAFTYNEIVSGSGTTFTLANTPVSGLYAIYGQGQRLYPTADFTISGAVITTVNSWLAGNLLADYQH